MTAAPEQVAVGPPRPGAHLQVTYRCTCGCPPERHLGHARRGRCVACPRGVCQRYRRDPEDRQAQRVLASLDEDFRVAATRHDRRRRRSYKTARARARGLFAVGPSDVGSCRKAIEYRERPPEDYRPLPEDRAAAWLGTVLHEGYTRLTRSLYPWRETNVTVHVPGFDEPGAADVYDPVLHLVEDLKTAGDWAWERVGRYGPFDDDVDQAHLYGYGLRAAGRDVAWVQVTYLSRNSAEAERFVYPYDETRALRAAERLQGVLDALHAGLPLPRDREGPTLDGICRRCPARAHCWSIDEAEAVGRTPEGWLLAREDPQIAAALASYLTAHEAAKPHDAVKERVKVLVRGVEPGIYGDAVLSWSGGRTEWVPDVAERVEQLAAEMLNAREEARPPDDPALLPMPQQAVTSTRRISVKPVRAAHRQTGGSGAR